MAFATVHFHGRSLNKASTVNVLFPDDPSSPRPWATFYLLHGLSDDHTIWMRRTSLERYVGDLPLVVVMPDGGRGWYSNIPGGYAHEDELLIDVVGLIERTFPVRPCRSARAIGGLSMGGFGALKLALAHPQLFCSVTSHSGTLDAARDFETIRSFSPEYDRVFGSSPAGGSNDLFALAERLDPSEAPALWIDCGLDDFLLNQNRDFHRQLTDLGFNHSYHEFPGGHDWDYWDSRIQDALAFHSAHLGLSDQVRRP